LASSLTTRTALPSAIKKSIHFPLSPPAKTEAALFASPHSSPHPLGRYKTGLHSLTKTDSYLTVDAFFWISFIVWVPLTYVHLRPCLRVREQRAFPLFPIEEIALLWPARLSSDRVACSNFRLVRDPSAHPSKPASPDSCWRLPAGGATDVVCGLWPLLRFAAVTLLVYVVVVKPSLLLALSYFVLVGNSFSVRYWILDSSP
jgi:hypothetical protein